jgi:DNA-binding GntR family transcriptional regulator
VSVTFEQEPPVEDGDDGQTSALVVYYALKQAIVSGSLAHEQPISQVKLSEEFAVSRTPVREAIRMLQAEGWVESEPNKRVRVASVSPGHIEQTYAMRITLEAMAIGLSVPKLDADDLAELTDLVEDMRRHSDANEFLRWEVPHTAFHRALTRRSGDAIHAACANLAQASSRYRSIYVTQEPSAQWQTQSDHQAILDACIGRDAAAASSLLARHLARTAIHVLALLDPGREPVPVRFAVNLVAATAVAP